MKKVITNVYKTLFISKIVLNAAKKTPRGGNFISSVFPNVENYANLPNGSFVRLKTTINELFIVYSTRPFLHLNT